MFSPAVLSIGLPVYNGERWIGHALDAIVSQGFQELDLIIADPGSSDGTESLVRRYAAADDRVRYVRFDAEQGLFQHHDSVIRLARGEYFKWASCSDVCLDGYFERAVALLDARPDVMLVSPKKQAIGQQSSVPWRLDTSRPLDDAQPSVERQHFLGQVRFENPFHGVIRRIALDGLSWNAVRPGAKSPLVDLAARGKHVELPDQLFLRRAADDATCSGVSATLVPRLAGLRRTATRGVIRAIRRYV